MVGNASSIATPVDRLLCGTWAPTANYTSDEGERQEQTTSASADGGNPSTTSRVKNLLTIACAGRWPSSCRPAPSQDAGGDRTWACRGARCQDVRFVQDRARAARYACRHE